MVKIREEKPWAVMGVSRKQYETARMWKKVKMSREKFDDLVCSLPPDLCKELHLIADGEKLAEAIFGAIQ